MYFASRDEVDDDARAIKSPEYPRKKAVRDGFPIRVDIEYDDRILDRHSRRHPPFFPLALLMARQTAVQTQRETLIRIDHRAISCGIPHILYPDRDLCPNDLLHRKGVDHLAAVVGELGGFVWCNDGDQSGGRHFPRVSGEDAVDLLPDL